MTVMVANHIYKLRFNLFYGKIYIMRKLNQLEDIDKLRDRTWEYPPFNDFDARDALLKAIQIILPLSERYDLIIGDDCSGRIPTLAARCAINLARRSIGIKPIRTTFIVGSSSKPADPNTLLFPEDKRALIVTEFIVTGDHTGRIIKKLGREAVDVLSVSSGSYGVNNLGTDYPISSVFSGAMDGCGLRYYKCSDDGWNGVRKRTGRRAHSAPDRRYPERVHASRKEAHLMGELAYLEFRRKNPIPAQP